MSGEAPARFGADRRFPAAWEEQALARRGPAFDVIDMVLAFPDWVHRRKERAVIESERRVRWHCSLDFTVPDLGRGRTRWFGRGAVTLVPLDLLSKKPLIGFDCRDGDDRPVPTLTRRQNGIVTQAGMLHWAAAIAHRQGIALTPQMRQAVCRIVLGDTARQPSRFDLAGEDTELDSAQVAGFMAMLEALAQNFVLVAVIDAAPGDRRIIKYCYERQIVPGHRALAERLGLRPTTIDLPVPMFRECESYHFEAVAPEGTHFSAVRLADLNPSSEHDGEELVRHDLRASSPHVAHLSISRASLSGGREEAPDPDSFTEPSVTLATELDRAGWLRSAGLLSFLVATFLLVTFPWVLGWGAGPNDPDWCLPHAVPLLGGTCVPESPEQGTGSDPAALFVGIVGVVTIVLAGRGEHAYTAQLVRPLRSLVWFDALLPVAAAWLIAFPGPGPLLQVGWSALTLAAVAVLAVLAMAGRGPRAVGVSAPPGTVR